MTDDQKPKFREWLYVGTFISQGGQKYAILDGPDIGSRKVPLVERSALAAAEARIKELEVGTVKLNAWLESAMRCLYDSSDVLRGKKESLDRTITSVVVEIEQEWVWPK